MSRFVDQFFTQITGPESAPRLVLLHGVMGYAANWRRVAKHFEDRYRVLAYDSRGHGRSVHAPRSSVGAELVGKNGNPPLESVADAYTPESLAEDLRLILNDLGWDKVTLVGHSMGGRVACTFAAQYPDRVEKLVIEDIGPHVSPIGASTVMRVLENVPVPFASKREAKQWFDQEFPSVFSDVSNAIALGAWLYANIKEAPDGTAVWRFDVEGVKQAVFAGRDRERWDEFQSLRVPTLVVRGERSNDLPEDVYLRMIQTSSNFQGVVIPGVGHWVHSENFEYFVAALDRFFAAPRSH